MRIDPVALELLTALSQYSTYDEVVVANKLFCLQGPWISLEQKDQISWYRRDSTQHITTLESSCAMFGPHFVGVRDLSTLSQLLEKLSCAK